MIIWEHNNIKVQGASRAMETKLSLWPVSLPAFIAYTIIGVERFIEVYKILNHGMVHTHGQYRTSTDDSEGIRYTTQLLSLLYAPLSTHRLSYRYIGPTTLTSVWNPWSRKSICRSESLFVDRTVLCTYMYVRSWASFERRHGLTCKPCDQNKAFVVWFPSARVGNETRHDPFLSYKTVPNWRFWSLANYIRYKMGSPFPHLLSVKQGRAIPSVGLFRNHTWATLLQER